VKIGITKYIKLYIIPLCILIANLVLIH